MDYTQITADQREQMLATIGVSTIDELFHVIPPRSRFTGTLDLPPAASEMELQRELSALAARNRGAHSHACFMGGGAYDHFIPAFVDQLISRGEFLTGYTPYQAEASQGYLQAFFEFQSQVARLTGLDISNASMYDGATSVAEAALLAINATGKPRILAAATLHPDTLRVLRTYLEGLADLVVVEAGPEGVVSPHAIAAAADEHTACAIVQSPNCFGLIEDWAGCFAAAKGKSGPGAAALGVAVFNPISLGLLKSPGACGADVAAGEGQPLGVPLQFGGPWLGLLSARKDYLRRMPGRLVGQTTDADGRRAFCLTLQTREQHIRGAKATSNICTNQGLLALRATMYMTAMGPGGMREVSRLCWNKAHYLAGRIAGVSGYRLKYDGEFFNEFVVKCPAGAHKVMDAARDQGLLLGPCLADEKFGRVGGEDELLVAVTEKRTREELDALADLLARLN